MRVLDLFSGLRGWSDPWKQAGHDVLTWDLDPRFGADIQQDILDGIPILPHLFDVVLASPPCETFSVASISHHWTGGIRAYQPKTPEAARGMQIVEATLALIAHLQPRIGYVIENPRGVLRNLGIIPTEPTTIWFCHYGDTCAKPTDLWVGGFDQWKPEPECHNRRAGHPDNCCCHDHAAAPRGAKTGTQGKNGAAARAKIPEALSLSFLEAANLSLLTTKEAP